MKHNHVFSAFLSILICAGILSFNLGSSTTSTHEIAFNNKVVSEEESLGRALQKLVTMPGGPPGAVAVVQRGEKVMLITCLALGWKLEISHTARILI